MYKEFWIILSINEWCSHRLVISIWVWSWLENLNSAKLTMKLSGCSYCSCCENLLPWIKCKYVAKALNLSMRLLRKDALSMKLLRKPELSINICRESLYVINVVLVMKKYKIYLNVHYVYLFRNSEKGSRVALSPKWVLSGINLL